MKKKYRNCILFFILIVSCEAYPTHSPIQFNEADILKDISPTILYLEDTQNSYSIWEVVNRNFTLTKSRVANKIQYNPKLATKVPETDRYYLNY